ncbi:MAG: DUF4230 domain-containing protein [Lachnospiraceae bacterium]|nr:DUF4230 domain-containing protein [Lachnospiraceae bacterium]
MKNILKKLSKKSLVILICCFIVVILIITTILFVNKNSRKKLEIITKSNLEKIINVSDLSTLEAVYNGIAKVTNNEEPDEVNYYVSYDAKIKAGIDFQQVDINLDNEKKVIKVKIPEIKINDINVDIASLDYIFMNDKANTKTVSEQAYEKCIEDVTSEVDTEDAIYELAKENAQNIIEALIKPFINQLDAEYKLEIN